MTVEPVGIYSDARGKALSVAIAGRSTFRNYYSGIGNLVATEWDNDKDAAQEVEEFRLDALGHQVWRRSANAENAGYNPEYVPRYSPGTSRVDRVEFTYPPAGTFTDPTRFARDSTFRTYDAAGNVQDGWERAWGTSYRKVQTRSYYGADGKLRAQQGYHELGGMYFTGERRGYFSEYRYDALGRRVLVRTRRDGLCATSQTSTVDCTSGIERYVWAGDNVLWEMRGPGGNTESAERLELDYTTGAEYGIVGYTHAGGVDRPLAAYKTAGGNTGDVVVPHMNWRGLFSFGTNPAGGASTVAVEWPGFRTTAYHSMGETQEQTKNWMGSLLKGQRDAGGQMYMRNRYYDPVTGQFTQTDPIGLAGGLNTYGFAAGDPVLYADPYGLCPIPLSNCFQKIANWGAHQDGAMGNVAFYGGAAAAAGIQTIAEVGAFVNGIACDEQSSERLCYASGPPIGPVGRSLGQALLREVAEPSPGMIRQFQTQLTQHGRRSVERAVRRLLTRLDQHVQKLEEITGDPSSIVREIRNYRRQIEAAKRVLESTP